MIRYLSLALLPALAAEVGQSNPVSRASWARNPASGPGATAHSGEQVPYLTAVTPVAVRLEDPPSLPDYDVEPVAVGPAVPDEISPPLPTLTPTKPDVIVPAQQDAKATGAVQQPGQAPNQQGQQQKQKSTDQEILPILPDDMRRDVRPEDLIPFFQFPRGGVNVVVPVPPQPTQPAAQPPSSATYTQQ